MTVAELIEHLRGFPQDLPVAYAIHSEYDELKSEQIRIKHLCLPRSDGWIHDARPDKPTVPYVVFPGN
jgi:hypothetical protein